MHDIPGIQTQKPSQIHPIAAQQTNQGGKQPGAQLTQPFRREFVQQIERTIAAHDAEEDTDSQMQQLQPGEKLTDIDTSGSLCLIEGQR